MRTGCDCAYPGSHGKSCSGSRRLPSRPYMICSFAGSPATARTSHSRHAFASARNPVPSSACSVKVASRNQQNR